MRSIIRLYFLLYIIPVCLLGQELNGKKNKEHLDITFQVLKEELIISQKRDSPKTIAEKHLRLGTFYQKARMFNEAIEQYNNALLIIEEKDTLTVYCKNEIGKIYLSLKNNSKAKKYFEESIAVSEEFNYVKGEAITKGLIGAYYEKEGNYLKALSYQKEGLELFKKLNDREGIATVNENIGSVYEDLEQYDLAYQYFKKSEKYFQEKNTSDLISVYNNLGDILRKTEKYEEAIDYTFKAYHLAVQFEDKYQIKSAHKDLSKAYALTGNYKKAFNHLRLSEEITEKLIVAQNAQQLHTSQVVYETQQKESKINLLLQQKEISKANQELLLVSLIATILIAIILFLYFKRKRKENIRIQEYRQRTLKAELEKKAIEEKNLQRAIHLKTAALSRYSLHIAQKNKILSDLSTTLSNLAKRRNVDFTTSIKKMVKEINFDLKQEKEWGEFNNIFEEIHPDFIKKLSSLSVENLSPAELRLGMLLRLNLSSKEIASILRVTPDSVRVARYRLRKKLPIDQKEELVNFMIAL